MKRLTTRGPAGDNVRIDNSFIDTFPKRAGKSPSGYIQLDLQMPGLYPFSSFDQWVTLAIYSLLDGKHPEEPIFAKPSDLMDLLQFTRIIDAADPTRIPTEEDGPRKRKALSRDYALVYESLHRLSTIYCPLKWITKDGLRLDIPNARIIENIGYVYEDELLQRWIADTELPKRERKNVNQTVAHDRFTSEGEDLLPPIYRYVDDRRFHAIRIRMSRDFMHGLKGTEYSRGYTVVPSKIFELRPFLKDSPTAAALLMFALRRPEKDGFPFRVKTNELVEFVGLDRGRPANNRDSILTALETLHGLGVLDDISFDTESGTFSFVRREGWKMVRKR